MDEALRLAVIAGVTVWVGFDVPRNSRASEGATLGVRRVVRTNGTVLFLFLPTDVVISWTWHIVASGLQ